MICVLRERARVRALPALVLLSLCLPLATCGARVNADDARLTGTFESPAAAAAAVVAALADKNGEALRGLALSDHEFRTVVWPELPSSRPEVNLPVEYAWGTLHQTSLASLGAILGAHGGRRYAVLRVEFAGPTTQYSSFAVHRDARVIVRSADGAEHRLALFGSILERNGRFKIFSYVTD